MTADEERIGTGPTRNVGRMYDHRGIAPPHLFSGNSGGTAYMTDLDSLCSTHNRYYC